MNKKIRNPNLEYGTLRQAAGQLPTVNLKTKTITFDDRMQQVRIIEKDNKGRALGRIQFLSYHDDKGYYYVNKYRSDTHELFQYMFNR